MNSKSILLVKFYNIEKPGREMKTWFLPALNSSNFSEAYVLLVQILHGQLHEVILQL